ncbi:thioesterase II family protein [Micromonospora maritima]|uniref:Thioesterase II family protein n=1 Tax=Micromonospora maritima TaxID=986711 RepID=A0ABW7ZT64_9ACTN
MDVTADPPAPGVTAGAGFSRWLLRRPADDVAGRVFCFPYSGVGGSMFSAWPHRIGDIEICPVQLPGRENRIREPHFGTYEQLAVEAVEALAPYLDRPYALFGHCAAALAAFETAREIVSRGLPAPRRLVVSAQVAPHHCPHDRFLDMTDDELSDELAAIVVARGGTPHPMLISLTLQVLHGDLDANRRYRIPAPAPLPFGTTVVRWSEDAEVTSGQLQGWREYGDDVKFTLLPGCHYAFLDAPPPLLETLRDAVARNGTT